MKKLILIVILLLAPPLKISADEILSPHTMGHILGSIGSFFLGPLTGIGLSVLPELLDSAGSSTTNNDSGNSKTIFYVNEYSKEFQIEPYLNENDEESITKLTNSVKLTNSLQYF